ncbi:hypothetical protein K9L97_01370 [Candidatus Woesearchaeota archaeon]|nr:hypothetical protein [Candidatus Woesearchaeota archaeon]
MKKTIQILIIGMLMVIMTQVVSANLILDSVQFDPPIITSGDQVDLYVQYHDEIDADDDRTNNPDYEFKVVLDSADTITKEYVTIFDADGDDQANKIIAGAYYYKKYRLKINQNAPAGTYQFKLSGQWYYKGNPENTVRERTFLMTVKKEGIIMNVAQLRTEPAEVRPGDNYVKIVSVIENSGEKSAKSIEVNLELPPDITASYTDNNRQYIGILAPGESKEINFFVDIDNYAKTQIYKVNYNFQYMDLDNNKYEKEQQTPFYVKPRPYLDITKTEGSGLAGTTSNLKIYVKNTGTESAESVDVRIVKQNSQPFNFDVRSDYIGELEPGEEGIAIIPVSITSDAEIKTHDFKVMIRSKGDSDEGDDNIYTYNRRASFEVTGTKPDYTTPIGIAILAIIVLFLISRAIVKNNNSKANRAKNKK